MVRACRGTSRRGEGVGVSRRLKRGVNRMMMSFLARGRSRGEVLGGEGRAMREGGW